MYGWAGRRTIINPYSHAPPDYACPFCQVVAGIDRPGWGTRQSDVVYRNSLATAFIAAKWWPNNPGHVLVVPNPHFENLFDLPTRYAAYIHEAAQVVARAMKAAYGCQGISTRQHNEPAGQQDVFHYHLHVYPRYLQDDLYLTTGLPAAPEDRASAGDRIRQAIAAEGAGP